MLKPDDIKFAHVYRSVNGAQSWLRLNLTRLNSSANTALLSCRRGTVSPPDQGKT